MWQRLMFKVTKHRTCDRSGPIAWSSSRRMMAWKLPWLSGVKIGHEDQMCALACSQILWSALLHCRQPRPPPTQTVHQARASYVYVSLTCRYQQGASYRLNQQEQGASYMVLTPGQGASYRPRRDLRDDRPTWVTVSGHNTVLIWKVAWIQRIQVQMINKVFFS